MKIEISIPNSLNEVNLAKFQAFHEVVELNKDNASDEFLSQKLISIFCSIKLNHVGAMRYTYIAELVDYFTALFNQKHKFINRFELGGVEFGFIPNLESISMDEFIDLDVCLGDWAKIHKAMAVLYRPITKTKKDMYEIEPYCGASTYSDLMKNAPLDVVLGAKVFFWSLRYDLLQSTLLYLESETRMIITNYSNSSEVGAGTIQSINSLRVTLQDLKKLEDFLPENALRSSLMKLRKTKLKDNK